MVIGLLLLMSGAVFSASAGVPRFGIYEEMIEHSGDYVNPYASLEPYAQLRGPEGTARKLPLFWDGGRQWKMRFSPDQPGGWSWKVISKDAGLNGASGEFVCVRSRLHGGIKAMEGYPYHFARQDGTPFWWYGDTNWSIYGYEPRQNMGRKEVKDYVKLRARQGFNVIHGILLRSRGNQGGPTFFDDEGTDLSRREVRRLRRDYYPELGDHEPFAAINPSNWQEVENRVRLMNSHGITAGMFVGWAQSWDDFPDRQSQGRYLRQVVARFSAYNVFFIVSGEFNEKGDRAMYASLGRQLDEWEPHGRLIGIHSTSSVTTFAGEEWMSFGDYQQLYSNLHGEVAAARDRNKPVVNGEYAYYLRDIDGDGLYDKPNSATLEQIRVASWEIVMAGGYFVTGWGNTYAGGRKDPREFEPEHPKNDPWEEDAGHIPAFFNDMEWWKLQPGNDLVKGGGTGYCLAEIGRRYVVYARGAREPWSLDTGGAPETAYRVRLYDPRTGEYTGLGKVEGRGPFHMKLPSEKDWVVLFERSDLESYQPPCASLGLSRETVAAGEEVVFEVVLKEAGRHPFNAQWSWGKTSEPIHESGVCRVVHSWDEEGEYDVRLTLKEPDSDHVLARSNSVEVSVSSNRPPVIYNAIATPQSGPAPLRVVFDVHAMDPEGEKLLIEWDAEGDGIIDGQGHRLTHVYEKPGHYDPVVRVSDGERSVRQQLTVDVSGE
jgi:hypothetical protein